MAICTHVEPAPVTVTPLARAGRAPAMGAIPANSTAAIARRIRRMPSPPRALAETSVHVVGGPRVLRVTEDPIGGADLDDAAGLVLRGQEERRLVGDSLRLLHVVG